MSTINVIPLEVLHNILDSIASIRTLSECRRVCKRWDPEAEAVMFSKKINLFYSDSLIKLHNQLLKKPHLARHVKYIKGKFDGDDSALMISLVNVAFTPKMEVLLIEATESVLQDIHFQLIEMVRQAPNLDYKLKILPTNYMPVDEKSYIDTAIVFKNTLQHLQTSYSCTALFNEYEGLAVFKSLLKLRLYLEEEGTADINKLESILKNCHGLQELELNWDSYDPPYDRTARANWSKQDVQQVPSLHQVNLSCPTPLLIQYLVYKYPNIKSWTTELWTHDYEQLEDALSQLPALMPALKLELSFDIYSGVGGAISSICDKYINENVTVYFSYGVLLFDNAVAEMNVTKDQTGIAFDISLVDSATYADQAELIDFLETATSRCDMSVFRVDLLSWNEEGRLDSEKVTFYDFVYQSLYGLKHLDICIDFIDYEPREYRRSSEPRLTHLTIKDAMIDDRVLPQVSALFPNLSFLTLASCGTFNADSDDNQDNMMYDINLPSSTILKLELTTSNTEASDSEFELHCLRMDRRSRVLGNCYVKISILYLDTVLYCKLTRFSPPVQVTKEEFESRQDKNTATCISITCNRLLHMAIRLGVINQDLNIATLLLERPNNADHNAVALASNDITNDLEKFRGIMSDYQSNYHVYNHYLESILQDIPQETEPNCVGMNKMFTRPSLL